MKKRNILSFLLAILIAFTFIACGGGGGGNEAPTYSLVGTWDWVSWSGGVNQPPVQLTFNANGTGSYSESAANIPEAGTFTWSLSGNTLTGNFIGIGGGTADLAWTDNDHVKMTVTSSEDKGMVINWQRRSSTTTCSSQRTTNYGRCSWMEAVACSDGTAWYRTSDGWASTHCASSNITCINNAAQATVAHCN